LLHFPLVTSQLSVVQRLESSQSPSLAQQPATEPWVHLLLLQLSDVHGLPSLH